MKLRLGFVSNSSSSCFILDICDEETEKIVNILQNNILYIKDSSSLFSRRTCYGIGKDVTEFAKDLSVFNENYVSEIIFNMAEKLGEENLVFIRISDEDNGISINIPSHLIYAEMEYH